MCAAFSIILYLQEAVTLPHNMTSLKTSLSRWERAIGELVTFSNINYSNKGGLSYA